MEIFLDKRAVRQIRLSAQDAIEEGDTETLREDILEAFTEEQVEEIERRLDSGDFFEFLTDMLDEWSGDDVEELFELMDAQLGDVGVDVKFEKKPAAAAEDEEEESKEDEDFDDDDDLDDEDEDEDEEEEDESDEPVIGSPSVSDCGPPPDVGRGDQPAAIADASRAAPSRMSSRVTSMCVTTRSRRAPVGFKRRPSARAAFATASARRGASRSTLTMFVATEARSTCAPSTFDILRANSRAFAWSSARRTRWWASA